MNDTQKAKIAEYRKAGMGYSLIAEVLGISKNTVVGYCRKIGLTGRRAPEVEGIFCRGCGIPLTQSESGRVRKFCSAECRQRWWNAHLELVNRKAWYTFTCAFCGKTCKAYGRRDRKYCGRECYIKGRFGERAAPTPGEGMRFAPAPGEGMRFAPASDAVPKMDCGDFDREMMYQTGMNLFASLLRRGLITEGQYKILNTGMIRKYRPVTGSICVDEPAAESDK